MALNQEPAVCESKPEGAGSAFRPPVLLLLQPCSLGREVPSIPTVGEQGSTLKLRGMVSGEPGVRYQTIWPQKPGRNLGFAPTPEVTFRTEEKAALPS